MSNIMNTAAPETSAALVPEAASSKRTGPRFRLTRRWVWRSLGLLALVAMVVLAAFGPFPWQLLGQGDLAAFRCCRRAALPGRAAHHARRRDHHPQAEAHPALDRKSVV